MSDHSRKAKRNSAPIQLLSARELSRERGILLVVGFIVLVLGLTPYFGPIFGFGDGAQEIVAAISYGHMASYDEDNDGVAAINEVIDFSVGAQFNWAADEGHLASWWRVMSSDTNSTSFVCNGAQMACEFIGANAQSALWNESFYLYNGLHGATENNTVSVQVLYVNYSLDIENASAQVYDSSWVSLPALFEGNPENESNQTGQNTPPSCVFPNITIEKNNPLVIDLENYCSDVEGDAIEFQVGVLENITIDWETGTGVFTLTPLQDYTGEQSLTITASDGMNQSEHVVSVVVYEEPIAALRCFEFPNMSIYAGEIRTIDLSEYCTDEGDLPITYTAHSNDVPILIEGGMATFDPSTGAMESAIGTYYAFFSANTSENLAVGNVFAIEVMVPTPRETLIQLPAQVGHAVKWEKRVSSPVESASLNATVPQEASNITVITINSIGHRQLEEDRVEIHHEGERKTIGEFEDGDSSRGPVAFGAFSSFRSSTNVRSSDEPLIVVNTPAQEIVIEYETPAPTQSERPFKDGKKQITIGSEFHYVGVKASTDVPEVPSYALSLYWIRDGERTPFTDIAYIDANNNSLIERIEWIVPHLSNQTFELELSVLDVQSYPMVGGEWKVRFTTLGTANLTISAINTTTYSEQGSDDPSSQNDLSIRSLHCENETLFDSAQGLIAPNTYIINGSGDRLKIEDTLGRSHEVHSLFVEDYSCDNQIGYWTVDVLTPGVHNQQFVFGNKSAYANNYALLGNRFVDNTHTDFGNGTLHLTNVSGIGSLANVTLNFTIDTSGINSGNPISNLRGNFTSRIMDSRQNHTVFDKIAWEQVLPNTTDVVGHAVDSGASDVGVFYRNGSFGVDTTQANLASTPVAFNTALFRYTLPTGFLGEDIVGFAMDDSNLDRVDVFFRNGSTSSTGDLGNTGLAQNIAFTGTSTWSIPAGFNTSKVFGFAIDSGTSQTAVFFRNGSYIVEADKTAPHVFTTVRSFSMPGGFSTSNALGVTHHNTGQDIAIFYANGTYLSDGSQADFSTNIDFLQAFAATYHTGVNLTESTNITIQTRVSNDTLTWTPWSSEYLLEDSQDIQSGRGRYIQYKAVLSTHDKYFTPILENISINYTIDIIAPEVNTSINNTSPHITQIINFTANVSDGSALEWCRFYDNMSGPTGIRIFNHSLRDENGKCSQNYTIFRTRGNVINFTLLVNDTYGNINSTSRIITVANAQPVGATILSPQSNEYTRLQPQPFNVTFPRDLDGDAISIRYYVNGILNQTSSFNTTFNASDGQYLLNVSLTDGIGWSQNTTVNFTLDTTRPQVGLIYPMNGTWNLSGLLQMSYAIDEENPSHCTLFTNVSGVWRANQTNSSQFSGIGSFFNTTSYAEGNYIWNVYCNDTAGNIGFNATNSSIFVDTNNPRIQFAFPTPVNNTNISRGTQTFNVTHNESNAQTLIFSLNSSFDNLSVSYLGRAYTNITNTSLHGTYEFYFWANDSSGRYNQTDMRVVNIDTRFPVVALESPLNNTWNTSLFMNFTYNVIDDFLGTKNCTLFIGGGENLSNTTITEGISQYYSLTLNNTAEGIVWRVNCTDYAGNSNTSETRLVRIDATIPSIQNASINTTAINVTRQICLNVTVADTFSGIDQVIAEINRPESGLINLSLTNDTTNPNNCRTNRNAWSYAYTALDEGEANWTSIYAIDVAGNINHTKFFGLNWSQVASIFINTTLLHPLVNFEINESNTLANYSFQMVCNATCRLDSTLPCQNVNIRPQFYNESAGQWADINNFTSPLYSNAMNKTCGSLPIGSHCNATFQITTTQDSGNQNLSLRCRARGSNTPNSFTDLEPNTTINDHPTAVFSSPQDTENVNHVRSIFTINTSDSFDDQNISRYIIELDDTATFASPSTLCDSNQSNCTFNTFTQTQCIQDAPNCYLRLNLTDSDGLKNSTRIRIQIDNTPPTIRLESPSNATYSSNSNVLFQYTAFDTNLSACALYHNESGSFERYNENLGALNNTLDSFIPSLSDNLLAWNIGCNDSAGNRGFNSTNYTLIVDTVAPSIRLNQPLNQTLTNNNTPSFNFTVWDTNLKNCSIYANFSGTFMQNDSLESPIASRDNVLQTTPIADGFYEWDVRCYDHAQNNAFNSTPLNFRIDTIRPTEFNLSTPMNDTQTINRSPFLNWTETSDDNFLNYTLLVDNNEDFLSPNFAYKLGGNSSNNSFFVPTQWGGNTRWFWKVVAYDSFNLSRNSTDYYSYIIDNITPSINLSSPSNNTLITDSITNFRFNASDANTLSNCSIITGGQIVSTTAAIQNGAITTLSVSLPNGNYNWSMNCTDKAGNTNASEFRNLTVRIPPLFYNDWIETEDTDFDQGTLFRTAIAGTGIGANVTLNYTPSTSGIARGIPYYNFTGNFTSQPFDTLVNTTRFDRISWMASQPNSSDVLGYAFQTTGNDIAVFYRNGSYGTDNAQTVLGADTLFTLGLRTYTIPTGWSRNDIIGFAADDDNGPNAYAFFKNGSVAIDAGQADFDTVVAFSTTTSFSIPAGLNVSDIFDFAFDTVTNGAAGVAAAFFKNGTYVYTGSATETGPFVFDTYQRYTIPSSFESVDKFGVGFDSGGQAAIYFRNRSLLSDATQGDLNSQIDFTGTFLGTYQSDANLTENNNITIRTRLSNNSIVWTPWSNPYTNLSGQSIIPKIARYIQYQAVPSTNDQFITPALENVSINFTDVTGPNITLTIPTPANNTIYGDNYVFVNSSLRDAMSISECTIEFGSTNTTMLISREGRVATCAYNITSLSEGAYGYRVYANDSLGNSAFSETRNVTIDLTAPSITIIGQFPDPVHNFENVSLVALISDSYQLNSTFIEGNWSGSFVNESLTDPVGSSYNKTIFSQNLSSREFVYYRFHANDTAGNSYVTPWINFTVVPSLSNITIRSPLFETNRYVNETIHINASVAAINGTIRNCLINLSNQSGLSIIGQTNRTVGNLTNGTMSSIFGWELNGTIPGTYMVNLTTNCTEGDTSIAYAPLIEIISSLTNFSNTLFIEKRTIDGSDYFHSTSDTAVNWWVNLSNHEEIITFDQSRPQSAWFSTKWIIIVNNSIVLDFRNVTWDQQKASSNNETNTTSLQFTGRALQSSLQVNMTKVWKEHSLYDNLTFDVKNIGDSNFSDIKLKWIVSRFNIGNDSDTDTLIITNATSKLENLSMDAQTSIRYNASQLNSTSILFSDPSFPTRGIIYWEWNMSTNGIKSSLHNFTLDAGGSDFSVNLTFHLGDLNASTTKSLDPGAGLATPGSIRRTATIATMESSEVGTTYTDVTIPLTDGNIATQDFIEARSGDTVRVLNIINNTDPTPFDQIFLRMRVDSMGQSPYYTAAYAYNADNVTVNLVANANHTFTNAMANTWVNVNITSIAHLHDGLGYMRVRFTPNASVVGNNVRLTLDEIHFNLTDMTPPRIVPVAPLDNFNTTSNTILFNFSVSDKVDMNSTCNVTLDGAVILSSLNITNGSSYNFTRAGLSTGVHAWNVTCWDDERNQNTSLTRNFTVVQGPSSIVASLAPDNESINLTWEGLSWADGYNVHIISGFTEQFSATPNATVRDANFTDRNAGNLTSRFYRITALKGAINHTTNITVGKYEFELINNSNSVTDWQLISLPLNITNFNLTNGSNAGMDLSVRPHGCIQSLYFYNATIPKFMRTDYNGSAWIPAAGSENFTSLSPGVGYWAEVNRSCNLTFVGEVPRLNITSRMEQGWNIGGWYSPNASILPMDFAPPSPIVVDPQFAIQAIDRYNPVTDQFEVTIHYEFAGSGWGWWPSFNNQDFTTLEPTRGYYFDSTSQSTWTIEPNTKRDDQ